MTTKTRTARQTNPPMGAIPRFHPLTAEQVAEGNRMWTEWLAKAAVNAPAETADLVEAMSVK